MILRIGCFFVLVGWSVLSAINVPSMSHMDVVPRPISSPVQYESFIDWSVACLTAYDERQGISAHINSSVLTSNEFIRVIRMYNTKVREKGIIKFWPDINQNTAAINNDFTYPYATVLDVEDGSKVCFMGDLHGSLHSLLRNLWRLVALGYLDETFKITKKNFYLIFTGDYTDRGRYGVEVLYTLLRLKCANWGRVHLVRGNHEVVSMNKRSSSEGGGLFDEMVKKYNGSRAQSLMALLSNVYNTMPLVVYIIVHKQVIKVVHGGFAPYEYYFDIIKKVEERVKNITDDAVLKYYFYIPLSPEDSLVPGYQWCDFDPAGDLKDIRGITYDAGRVWRVGLGGVQDLLDQAGVQLLVRGHQHSGFGLKVMGVADNKESFAPHASSIDKVSGQYHWVAALQHIDPKNGTQLHNNDHKSGFLVSQMLPVLTFSSSPEGVGQLFDCFGILSLDGMFPTWRLKVYEYPSSFCSRFKSICSKQAPFTVLMAANPKFIGSILSSSGMADVVFVKFLSKQDLKVAEHKDLVTNGLKDIAARAKDVVLVDDKVPLKE